MNLCPFCKALNRRRGVGTDGQTEITVCNCWAPIIDCWRELLAVHDATMQQPRRSQ